MKTTNGIAQEATAQVFEALSDVNTSTAKVLTIITKAIEAAMVQGEPVDLRQRLGEALNGVLTDDSAASEPDWHDAREIDRVIDSILPALRDASPPKRQPLTDDRLREIFEDCVSNHDSDPLWYGREIEAAINGGGA